MRACIYAFGSERVKVRFARNEWRKEEEEEEEEEETTRWLSTRWLEISLVPVERSRDGKGWWNVSIISGVIGLPGAIPLPSTSVRNLNSW